MTPRGKYFISSKIRTKIEKHSKENNVEGPHVVKWIMTRRGYASSKNVKEQEH